MLVYPESLLRGFNVLLIYNSMLNIKQFLHEFKADYLAGRKPADSWNRRINFTTIRP